MKAYVAQEDVDQWAPLIEWLERPKGTHAPVQTSPPETSPPPATASA
jgi:hypothetical protein